MGRNPYFTRFCCAMKMDVKGDIMFQLVAILILLDFVVQFN